MEVIEISNVEQTIEKLEKSPLFYLFLSSRELFHSNFWLWLSTVNKSETVRLFSEKPVANDINFKREYNQTLKKSKTEEKIKSKLDLFIYQEIEDSNKKKMIKPEIVIENKVKDFPKKEQLQRIKQSFGEKENDIHFILTTLFWREDFTENIANGWSIKTYRQIAEAIEPSKFTDHSYYLDLIADYKAFTINLSQLSENLEITNEFDFHFEAKEELFKSLNKINLWEAFQKMRASHLLLEFEKVNDNRNIKTNYSINNQKATIDFRINLNWDAYKIGIQLEGNQYRKFVEGNNAGIFAEQLIKNNLFFDPKKKYRKNAIFLNYGTSFKYQYDIINEVITFEDLFGRIKNDIEFIIQNEQEFKKIAPNSFT